MKPYYQSHGITIYHADSTLHPELFTHADVMITDPPYGMNYKSGRFKDRPLDQRAKPITNDHNTETRDTVLNHWGGVKPALVFGTWRQPKPANTINTITWVKTGVGPGPGNLNAPWGAQTEEIYVLGKWTKQPGIKREPNYILEPTLNSQAKDRPPHPTPKPLTVIHHLLKHTPPDAHITDPFLGSGQTLLACAQTGRTATGIEIDETYCELAATRIDQYLNQERLF